jgi:anti-anti-sigma regulatory factor
LTEVPYADSAAIGSIVNAYVSRQNSGRKMVVAAGDRVQKAMQITKVATLFPIFFTVGEAIRSLEQNRDA